MYNHTSIPGNHEHHPTNDDPDSVLPLFFFFLSRLLPALESPFTEKVQRTKGTVNICLTHTQGDLNFIFSFPLNSTCALLGPLIHASCCTRMSLTLSAMHSHFWTKSVLIFIL
ncbi:unnamed protein product [Malus baccata var. baccata]